MKLYFVIHTILIYIIVCCLLYASVIDLITRSVSNKTILVLMILGLIIAVIQHKIIEMTIISSIVFSFLIIFWYFGWLGGGDVKLISVIILGLTPGAVVTFVAAVSLFGGVLAVAYGIGKKVIGPPHKLSPVSFLSRAFRVECWRIYRGRSLPYICAIFAGYLYSVF